MRRATIVELLPILGSMGAAAGCAAACLALVQGCSLRNCDATVVQLGGTPPNPLPPGETYAPPLDTQHMVDETTWESVPIGGTYLEFPGQRAYVMNPSLDGFHGPFTNIIAYVSSDPQPALNGSNFTVASGNLAEIQFLTDDYFTIRNDTCATYYLRVVVTRALPDAGVDAAAPTDAEAGAADGEAGLDDAGAPDADLDAADAGGS